MNPEEDDCSSSNYVFQRSSLESSYRSSSLCTFVSKVFLFLQNKLGGSLTRMIIVLFFRRTLAFWNNWRGNNPLIQN